MYDIKESQNKDVNVDASKILNAVLQEKLTDVDIDRSNWIGKIKKSKHRHQVYQV